LEISVSRRSNGPSKFERRTSNAPGRPSPAATSAVGSDGASGEPALGSDTAPGGGPDPDTETVYPPSRISAEPADAAGAPFVVGLAGPVGPAADVERNGVDIRTKA
jgi:hypothetical protein